MYTGCSDSPDSAALTQTTVPEAAARTHSWLRDQNNPGPAVAAAAAVVPTPRCSAREAAAAASARLAACSTGCALFWLAARMASGLQRRSGGRAGARGRKPLPCAALVHNIMTPIVQTRRTARPGVLGAVGSAGSPLPSRRAPAPAQVSSSHAGLPGMKPRDMHGQPSAGRGAPLASWRRRRSRLPVCSPALTACLSSSYMRVAPMHSARAILLRLPRMAPPRPT